MRKGDVILFMDGDKLNAVGTVEELTGVEFVGSKATGGLVQKHWPSLAAVELSIADVERLADGVYFVHE